MARKQKEQPKVCKRCGEESAIQNEKYCKQCKKDVLRELKASGYFTDTTPPKTPTEERGRKAQSSKVIGGSAEFGTDGDDW